MMRSVVNSIDVAMPHPDLRDVTTLLAGVQKRFARKPPTPREGLLNKLLKFTDEFLHKNLIPLPPNSDLSVQHWLDNTNYPLYRKEELLKKEKRMEMLETRDFLVKLFMKDETYPAYKHGRGINSRSDEFKTAVGPIFKLIEHEVFNLHWFIKHIPVSERPKYISTLLQRHGATYFASDYTTFEALFTKDLMMACEFRLYRYMTKNLPTGAMFCDLVESVLGGKNKIVNKFFGMEIDATRMSGEMCTSLGNGFSNLMFMLFVLDMCGCKHVEGVVEGDDGLFTFSGKAPTSQDFALLGLDIKLESFKSLSEASFCGLIFDEVDLQNITDPIDVIKSFMWTSSRYVHAKNKTLKLLLKSKSLSYGWQYPGCPIIASLARFGLRATESVSMSAVDWYMKNSGAVNQYERSEFIQNVSAKPVPFVPISLATRLLMEKKFGVPIDHQIRIENYLDSLTNLDKFEIPFIDMYGHNDQRDYAQLYIRREKLAQFRPFIINKNEIKILKLHQNCTIMKNNVGVGEREESFNDLSENLWV